MRAVDVFLPQFDEAWRHEWESLMPVLEGVTEAEAAWQAPCYRGETGGSILWHVAHVAHCKRAYTARILDRPGTPVESEPSSFADALRRLEESHAAQRDVIAALADEDLSRVLSNKMPLDEYLTSIIRHDIWHAAQIAVARRLWRTRDVASPG